MISLTAEYALRAVVWLAGRGDRPVSTREIAEGTRVSYGYLAKVLQALGRVGLVESQRGFGGGFVLSRSPERTTVLDVINAFDPLRRIERCPLGVERVSTLCPLHRKLDTVSALVEAAFRQTTIAEILAELADGAPLCRLPGAERTEAVAV